MTEDIDPDLLQKADRLAETVKMSSNELRERMQRINQAVSAIAYKAGVSVTDTVEIKPWSRVCITRGGSKTYAWGIYINVNSPPPNEGGLRHIHRLKRDEMLKVLERLPHLIAAWIEKLREQAETLATALMDTSSIEDTLEQMELVQCDNLCGSYAPLSLDGRPKYIHEGRPLCKGCYDARGEQS